MDFRHYLIMVVYLLGLLLVCAVFENEPTG